MRASGMKAKQPPPKTNLAPLLITVIAGCIAVAIALTLLGRSGAPAAAPDERDIPAALIALAVRAPASLVRSSAGSYP